MNTLKRTAMCIGTLFAVACGGAMALEVPRSPAENEGIPQPPMLKYRPDQPPGKSNDQIQLSFKPAPARSTSFQYLDSNGDGAISPFEANEELAADFEAWDSNGDLKVSRFEYARYRSDRGTLARDKSTTRSTDRY